MLRFLLILLATLSIAWAQIPAVPLPAREFRGSWIATVRCINWPSEPGLPTAKQKQQLLTLLDRAAAMRLNAILFQVRPAADAMYRSSLEPWSPWLTGKMGQPPETDWDPLEFAIQEAHARGMELHAWFNPFRALATSDRFPLSENHVGRKHPDWCIRYGDSTWMNPGIQAVRDLARQVILDVVTRYDVDGVHIDDYFYPYPVKGKDGKLIPFPDSSQYAAYTATGGPLELNAWRRQGIDEFISTTYSAVKTAKKWVQVGISPFGLWRPNFPPGSGGGLDPYEDLAADSRKWLHQGWLDYLVPQLYWHTDDKKLSFPMYYQWWQQENLLGRHIYPGMGVDRVGKDRGGIEIIRQISSVRALAKGKPPGHLHWNLGELLKNKKNVADLTLQRGYPTFAIPPATPWLSNETLPEVTVNAEHSSGQRSLKWSAIDPRMNVWVRWWLLQVWDGKQWKSTRVYPGTQLTAPWPTGAKAVALRPLGRCWEAGSPALLAVP